MAPLLPSATVLAAATTLHDHVMFQRRPARHDGRCGTAGGRGCEAGEVAGARGNLAAAVARLLGAVPCRD